MDFADRLTFAATRSRRLALRHGVQVLAARACLARARARRQCSALQPSAMGAAAMPRALRSPWSGGYIALAQAAGVDRIEPRCDPAIAPTCTAPLATCSPVPSSLAA